MAWTAEYARTQHHGNITGPCKYRMGVDCDKFSWCSRCGWNPDVEEKRKKRLRPEVEKKEPELSFILGGATFDNSL